MPEDNKDGFMKRKKRNERDIQRADLIGECDQNDKRKDNKEKVQQEDERNLL